MGTGEIGAGFIGGKARQKKLKKTQEKPEASDSSKDKRESPPTKDSPLDFGDGSRIIFDWTTKLKGCIGPSVQQKEDICWAIVLSRILQAIYNLNKDPMHQYTFSFDELVSRLRASGEKLSVGSLKKALAFISKEGLMKESDTSGRKYTNIRIVQRFVTAENVTEEFIVNLLERCPVGVVIDLYGEELYNAQKDIYTVRADRQDEPPAEHALMITGLGETKDCKKFLNFQNSLAEEWGDRGFGRLAMNGVAWNIFYPDLGLDE